MVELTVSTIMMLLVIAAAGAVLGYLGWYAYNQKQIADAQVELASLQAAGVLQGGKFGVVFNRPVTVVKIGYGYYNERTGQEFGFQWMAVGKSGQAFQWDLGGSGYNATYVIADLGNGVYKVYRWHFVQITPQKAAQLSAAVASALSSGSSTGSSGSVTQTITVTNPPGTTPSSTSASTTSASSSSTSSTSTTTRSIQYYYAYVTVRGDNVGARWTIQSSVDSISGTSDVTNMPLKTLEFDWLKATVSSPPGYTCTISPTGVDTIGYGTPVFTVNCIATTTTSPTSSAYLIYDHLDATSSAYLIYDHLDATSSAYLIYDHLDATSSAYLIYDHLDATSSAYPPDASTSVTSTVVTASAYPPDATAYHHPAFHFADVLHLAYYSADGHSLDHDHKQRRRWRRWRRRRWRRIDYYGICNC